MLLLDYQNVLIESLLKERFSGAAPVAIDQVVSDFDGVTFHISTPESKTKILVSISLRCFNELVKYGAQAVLEREYGPLIIAPESGYDFSVQVDLESLPQEQEARDDLIKRISLLKRNAMAAPFEQAFDEFEQLKEEASKYTSESAPQGVMEGGEVRAIHYREEEAIFIKASHDRVTVIFSTIFREETDRVFGKVFLQEFVDARKRAIQNAPQVLFRNDPPLELQKVPGLVSGKGEVGYITFVLFPRHLARQRREEVISHIQTFRDYFHYHIKASKAYIHSRMRRRTADFLQVLRRARPDTEEKERKTASDLLLWLIIPLSIVVHLVCSPFTKVEESFNIQAIHDITSYGIPFPQNETYIAEHYDHVQFPGAVPRTFVGALFLALLSSPLLPFITSPKGSQLLVRGLLGLLNAQALYGFRQAIHRTAGRSAANWFVVLQASQFHLIYYASRTLPNMFALGLTTFALRNYVLALSSPPGGIIGKRRHALSLTVLTAAGVIFRSELAALVLSQTLYLLATRRISLMKTVIPAGIFGVLLGLLVTVPIDSFFWLKFPLWPEWVGFYYNTILGQSSNWGTSPWYFYYANALPRLLQNPVIYTILIPLAISSSATRQRTADLLVPGLSFVALYSILPHKEWRFIIYVVPAFTAAGAIGASWIWNRRRKSFVYRTLNFLVIVSVAASFILSLIELTISHMNYPGGEAMIRLHSITENSPQPMRVYADNLACQTGVTRFLESRKEKINSQLKWNFDKSENETTLLDPMFWHQFDFALVEHQERCIGKWEVVDVVTALDGLRVVRPGMDIDSTGDTVDDILLRDRHDIWQLWDRVGDVFRTKVTRGWWLSVRVVPKIKILRREKD